ncbi:MAG: hypothetical protein WBB39_03715 [Candidatus Saccharimonadales bacterium]
MINLIDKELLANSIAARRNVILRKYVGMFFLLIIAMTVSFTTAYFILDEQTNEFQRRTAQYNPIKERYADDVVTARNYSKNLKIAKTVLSSQVAFGDITTVIARTLPADAVLGTITISSVTLSKPIDFTISTKSYYAAIATKESFETSTYFSDVKIKTIDIAPDKTLRYGYVLVLSAKINMEKISAGETI